MHPGFTHFFVTTGISLLNTSELLRIDENHDGIAQPGELHALPELGVYAISLDYTESRRRDDFGNQFRYKAKINPSGGRRDERDERSEVGRWTYDVFLATTTK